MENQVNPIEMARHSLSHILAKAVCELYDDVKLAIGPAIENGFYYDFDLPRSITSEDFDAITAKMQEILKRGEDFVCREVSVDEAKAIFAKQPYKLELIEGLSDEKITLYYISRTQSSISKIYQDYSNKSDNASDGLSN